MYDSRITALRDENNNSLEQCSALELCCMAQRIQCTAQYCLHMLTTPLHSDDARSLSGRQKIARS